MVWDDEPNNLIHRAEKFEESLLRMIWGDGGNNDESVDEKKGAANVSTSNVDDRDDGLATDGIEEALVVENRPTLLINPVMVGMTITLLIAALGLGWRSLAQEFAIDGNFIRLALLAVTPMQIFVSLVSISAFSS